MQLNAVYHYVWLVLQQTKKGEDILVDGRDKNSNNPVFPTNHAVDVVEWHVSGVKVGWCGHNRACSCAWLF